MRTPADPSTCEAGLHVLQVDAPEERAAALVVELGAISCATREEASAHLVALQAVPVLSTEAVNALRSAGRRLATARSVVERTLQRTAADVGERLAATGSGLAVHPVAVRGRADAVLSARAAVAVAEEALRAHEAEGAAAEERAAERSAASLSTHEVYEVSLDTEVRPPPRRSLFGWLRRSTDHHEAGDRVEVSSLLRQVGETTDEAFGARRAASTRDDQLVLRQAQRDRAVEQLRVAERTWRDLAGDDPVEAVDDVVRRFDPQHQDALALARDTAGVRATQRLLADAEARWTEAWARAGHDRPAIDDPARFDEVTTLATRALVLLGDAVALAADIARAAPAAPVVVLEPVRAS